MTDRAFEAAHDWFPSPVGLSQTDDALRIRLAKIVRVHLDAEVEEKTAELKQQLDERDRQVETMGEVCGRGKKQAEHCVTLFNTRVNKSLFEALAKCFNDALSSPSPAVKECLTTEAPATREKLLENLLARQHHMRLSETEALSQALSHYRFSKADIYKGTALHDETAAALGGTPAPPMGESEKISIRELRYSLDYSLIGNPLVVQAFGVMRELRAWIEEHSEGMSSTPTVSVEASQHQLTVSIGAFNVWGSEANDSSELTLEWCLQEYIAEIENLRMLVNNHAAFSVAAEGEGE